MCAPEREQSKLIEDLTRAMRDGFLAVADLRDVRRQIIRERARAAARQLDIFTNPTVHEEPEDWQT